MKRVFIVTFFSGNNYGSRLQATALFRFLKDKGYEVYIIDKFQVMGFMMRHPKMIWGRICNRLNRNKRKKKIGISPRIMPPKQLQRMDQFEKDNINIISLYKEKDWKELLGTESVFVTGSDLTWHPRYGYPGKYFLDFAYYAKQKRIAYAASIGNSKLEEKYKAAYKRYLGSYSAIGVRETDSIEIIRPYTDTRIQRVVDPTLLLTAKQWDCLCNKAELSVELTPGAFVLCYFVMDDPKYWTYVKRIKKQTGTEIVLLPMNDRDNDNNHLYIRIENGTPYEFLWLIKNAGFICTDSYHACMLSIVYKKDFYLIRRTRKEEDSKYNEFLNRYDLQDRVVNDLGMFVEKPCTDYSKVSELLEIDREESIDFLLKEIEG